MLFNVLTPLIYARIESQPTNSIWHIHYQVDEVKVLGYQYVVVDAACRCECSTVRVHADTVLCYWHCVWCDSPSCFDKREYEIVLKNI